MLDKEEQAREIIRELHSGFESLGEKAVRERIAAKQLNDYQASIAGEWLRQKDQSRAEERERINAASKRKWPQPPHGQRKPQSAPHRPQNGRRAQHTMR